MKWVKKRDAYGTYIRLMRPDGEQICVTYPWFQGYHKGIQGAGYSIWFGGHPIVDGIKLLKEAKALAAMHLMGVQDGMGT